MKRSARRAYRQHCRPTERRGQPLAEYLREVTDDEADDREQEREDELTGGHRLVSPLHNSCPAEYLDDDWMGGQKAARQDEEDARRMQGCCYDCGRRYGDEYGFPDLSVADDVWLKISPLGGAGGLLCPSCICRRLYLAGIETTGEWRSGPLCRDPNRIARRHEQEIHEMNEQRSSSPAKGGRGVKTPGG